MKGREAPSRRAIALEVSAWSSVISIRPATRGYGSGAGVGGSQLQARLADVFFLRPPPSVLGDRGKMYTHLTRLRVTGLPAYLLPCQGGGGAAVRTRLAKLPRNRHFR